MWIDWYRKYQPAEPEYEVCWRVSGENESQTSYSVEQTDIFQYQSYSHSDDMFIILKSNINTDTQGFQSGPVPGTFTRLRSCIVPAEITEPPKISGGQNHKYDGR